MPKPTRDRKEPSSVCSAKIVSIVDDDEFVRNAISSLVRSYGWQISTFASAAQFLASDAVGEASCLICDVQMPGTTGVELQEYLNEGGVSIPTIFITAYPSGALRAQLMSSGALCLIEKPIDTAELASWLTRILEI